MKTFRSPIFAALAAAALSCAMTAHASSGQEVFQNRESVVHRSYSLGVLDGIRNMATINDFACIPPAATLGQLYDVVYKDLERMPKIRDKDYALIAVASMKLNYPCKGGKAL